MPPQTISIACVLLCVVPRCSFVPQWYSDFLENFEMKLSTPIRHTVFHLVKLKQPFAFSTRRGGVVSCGVGHWNEIRDTYGMIIFVLLLPLLHWFWQSKITREQLEEQRQLLVDLRHEIGELKSIHQAGVVGSKGGGTRGGYGTAMPASEFFKQGKNSPCSFSVQSCGIFSSASRCAEGRWCTYHTRCVLRGIRICVNGRPFPPRPCPSATVAQK